MSLFALIIAAALATYATRVAGHLVLLRFGQLGPRVEAALDAVPIAVLTAIVTPALVGKGVPEVMALIVAGLVGLRLSISWVVLIGLATLVALRTVL